MLIGGIMEIINFKNVNVAYEEQNVLNSINLCIKQGEHTAILGSNGSGKSTLIKLFSNDLYPRFSKDMTKEVFGKKVWDIWELKKHLGIITNDLHYEFIHRAPFLSGFEVVLSGFYSTFHIYDNQDFSPLHVNKANEVLAFLEIEHLRDKNIAKMSTGEIRKCIIARALVHDPKAMILDEPTVGLDIKAQINFVEIMRKIAQNSTVILITHHLEEIFEEISKVVLLKEGTIYKQGNKEEMLSDKNLSAIFNLPLHVSFNHGRYAIKLFHNPI